MYRTCLWSSCTIPADIVVEKLEWKTAARFYNHSVGMRSYLLKNNFKRSLQKHHFVYVYEVIIKYYLNFITYLYFPRPLIRWNSSHCHLMELFKSKESFKEKVDSNNNWKTAWPRMILDQEPRTRDPPQSLKVGPQDLLQNLKVWPRDPLQSLKVGPS